MSDRNTVTINETNRTVTIEDGNTVTVLQNEIEVASVGVQGPSGIASIGGKAVPTAAPTDDDLIIFDATQDAFILPKPHNSWTLNNSTLQWEAPTPPPPSPLSNLSAGYL